MFYIALMIAALALFFARIAFEAFCPPTIKSFPSLNDYVDRLPATSHEAILMRSQMLSEWKEDNNRKERRWIVTGLVCVFYACFLASFLLGIFALYLFGQR